VVERAAPRRARGAAGAARQSDRRGDRHPLRGARHRRHRGDRESLLYGVAVTDTLTFASVPALLTVVALLAALVPARRATRVNPVVAMRDE
jgi:hypothetical protein